MRLKLRMKYLEKVYQRYQKASKESSRFGSNHQPPFADKQPATIRAKIDSCVGTKLGHKHAKTDQIGLFTPVLA